VTAEIAVISACYGGIDQVWPAVRQSVPCDFHLFGASAEGWQSHDHCLCRNMGDVYRAKCPKVMPEYCLPEQYMYYLWMDSSIHITSDLLVEQLLSQMGNGSWLAVPHHQRSTVKDEVDHSLSWSRYASEPLRTQYGHYLRLGFEDTCLWANTIFLRRSTLGTRSFCAQWMTQILLWSYQDQCSLPYIFWQNKCSPIAARGMICWESPWHGYHGHVRKEYWK
jgi:hypothetical protein